MWAECVTLKLNKSRPAKRKWDVIHLDATETENGNTPTVPTTAGLSVSVSGSHGVSLFLSTGRLFAITS